MNKEIEELIESKNFKGLKTILQDMLVPDIADTLDNIEDPATTILVYRLLPKDLSAEVFSYISPEALETIVSSLNNTELSFIIEELATDDAVDFLEEMPANIVEKVLKGATP
ncbi:MAG: magnesium transporter, partial [Clostridia bacterium]|nr:magnesium transporter [Clostridia bacterium]